MTSAAATTPAASKRGAQTRSPTVVESGTSARAAPASRRERLQHDRDEGEGLSGSDGRRGDDEQERRGGAAGAEDCAAAVPGRRREVADPLVAAHGAGEIGRERSDGCLSAPGSSPTAVGRVVALDPLDERVRGCARAAGNVGAAPTSRGGSRARRWDVVLWSVVETMPAPGCEDEAARGPRPGNAVVVGQGDVGRARREVAEVVVVDEPNLHVDARDRLDDGRVAWGRTSCCLSLGGCEPCRGTLALAVEVNRRAKGGPGRKCVRRSDADLALFQRWPPSGSRSTGEVLAVVKRSPRRRRGRAERSRLVPDPAAGWAFGKRDGHSPTVAAGRRSREPAGGDEELRAFPAPATSRRRRGYCSPLRPVSWRAPWTTRSGR